MRKVLYLSILLPVIMSIVIVPSIFRIGTEYSFKNQGQSNLNATLVMDRVYVGNLVHTLVSAIAYRPTIHLQDSLNPYVIYDLYNPFLPSSAIATASKNFITTLGVSDNFVTKPAFGLSLAVAQPNLYYGDISYITNTFFTGGYNTGGTDGNPYVPYFVTMLGLYNNISPSSIIYYGNNISFSYACMQDINYCNSNAGNIGFSFWSQLNSLRKLFFGGVQSNAQQPPYTYPFILTTLVQFSSKPNDVNGLLYNINFNSSVNAVTQHLLSAPYTQAGDALGFNAAQAIQRPIVAPWVISENIFDISVAVPLGVNNLGLYGLRSNTPLYNSINWQLTRQVLQSLGFNSTTYVNIPILFAPYEINNSLLGLYKPTYEIVRCPSGVTPGSPQCIYLVNMSAANVMMGGFLSLLKYIPPSGYSSNWRTHNTVAFPYVIPLFTITTPNVPSNLIGQINASIFMPVLIFGDGQVTLLGTAVIGYDPYYNTTLITYVSNGTVTGPLATTSTSGITYYGFGGVAWVTGPGAGCNNITVSANVKPLSPYAQAYIIYPREGNVIQDVIVFVWDPEKEVGYFVNISDMQLTPQLTHQCNLISSANIDVKTYNLAQLGGMQYAPYTYVDIEFIPKGYVVFYRSMHFNGQPNVVQIYVLDLNTGKIYQFTQNIPILSYNAVSIPAVGGQLGSLLAFQSDVYIYRFKPEIFFGSLEPQASLPTNYTFSYSFAKVPVTIYYSGSDQATDVLVMINITDPRILSAIATPSAKDIRVFTTDIYGNDYYQYDGLTYAIFRYIPGQLLSLLILMPSISPDNNTIYIYMGYPYAKSVAVPAELLLSQYTLLQNE